MKKYNVLKAIMVESGPPFILPKGSTVILYKSPHHEKPVTGQIFTDKQTGAVIGENWKEYLEEAN